MSSPNPHTTEFAQNRPYPRRHLHWKECPQMPSKKNGQRTDFGARLSELRKAAGYTQQELAQEVGVSRRMIAYYEGETERPPTTLLPALADALGITTDELLGVAAPKKGLKPDTRLKRRMQQIEKMNPKEKRQVLQLIDAFIEREQLRKAKA
jgi:transcriptional regulator with XRE-family HTH domain